MLNSINTNVSAMMALRNLNATSSQLVTTQDRVNSGRKIDSAKDNAAIWAIAEVQRADTRSLNAVLDTLNRAQSITDVALTATQAISDVLIEIKQNVVSAAEQGISSASLKAYSDHVDSLVGQVNRLRSEARFDGINMLDGTGLATGASPASMTFRTLADDTATTFLEVKLDFVDYIDQIMATKSANGGTLTALVGALDTAIAQASTNLGRFGAFSQAIDINRGFIEKRQDALTMAVGNLVDADLGREGARLVALQTRQALGIQAMSIANAGQRTLLSLFA